MCASCMTNPKSVNDYFLPDKRGRQLQILRDVSHLITYLITPLLTAAQVTCKMIKQSTYTCLVYTGERCTGVLTAY